MHPVYSKEKFGIHGVMVRFYNGTTVTNGYITKQTATNKFVVTDGTHVATCRLAQTATEVTGIGSTEPTIMTIPLNPPLSTATGATFTVRYALDSTTTVTSGGAGYLTSDAINIDGGVRASATITIVTNPAAADTLTVNGTVVTFVASGATGNQVNIGASAAATAAALYTFLSASVDVNISKAYYYNAASSAVVNVIYSTSGTVGNAFTLATSVSAKITVPATLTGGTAATATTPSVVSAVQTGGVVTALGTITTAGVWPTLPTGSVYGYYNGDGRLPVTLTAKFNIATGTTSVTVSGGTGYTLGDVLVFTGMTDVTAPTAHVSAVTSGAPTQITVDTTGSGITAGATSISVQGPTEHVKSFSNTALYTVEGNRYLWTLTGTNGSTTLAKYS